MVVEAFNQIEIISFDCYGTLINWETGILQSLKPILERRRISLSDDEVLSAYAEFEPLIQKGQFLRYREVLRKVVEAFGKRFCFEPSIEETRELELSLPSWPSFSDTKPVLVTLAKRYRLAVLSNIDDDLFAETALQLGVQFDHIITAQQVKAYKPSNQHFRALFANAGVTPDRVLHVAESIYHDIVPAKCFGMKTVWVNRRRKTGQSATKQVHGTPDWEISGLDELLALIGC